MAVAFVQGKATEAPNALSVTANLTSAVTAGNLLVVGVYAFGETTSGITVTDTLGNTYTKILTAWVADSGGSDWLNLYYCVSASGGTNSVKAQGPSSSGFWGLAVEEHSGLGTPTIDVKGGTGANGTGTTYTGPSFTPTASGELLVAFHGNEDSSITITAGAGWTLGASSGTGNNNCSVVHIESGTATANQTGKWSFNRAMSTSAGSVYVTFTPGSGGTAHSQTVAATQAAAAALVRGVGKFQNATQTATATLAAVRTRLVTLASTQGAVPVLTEVRARVASLSATQAATAIVSQVRTRVATLTATQGTAAALVRGVGKALTATQTSALSLRRGIGKGLTATQGAASALTAIRVRLVTLAATQATAATITRGIGKVLSATQGGTATLAEVRARVISLAATQATTATALAQRVRLVALVATQATAATLRRGIGKSVASTQASAVSLARAIAKSVGATQSSVAGITPGRLRTIALAATQAATATLAQTRTRVAALVATQGTAGVLGRGIGKGLSAAQGTAAGTGRGVGKGLAVAQSAVAALGRVVIPANVTIPDVRAIARAGLRQLRALAGLRQPTTAPHALQPVAVPVAGPLVWSVGNQPPDSALWLQNAAAGNAAIDLSGCTVTARLSTAAGLDLWSGRGCTVPTPTSGQVRVPWQSTDFTAAGSYQVHLTIRSASGRTQTTLRPVPVTVQSQP